MRTLLITLLLVAGWAIGQTFYESVAPVSLGTADGINYYTVISGEGGSTPSYWTDPNESLLIARWLMDDTATNAAGLVNDSGATGNYDATNMPTFATGPTWTNNSGQGWYVFDEADDYLNPPHITGFWNSGDYTVASWIRGTDIVPTSGGQAILGVSDTAGNHLAMLGATWNSPVAGVWNVGMTTYEGGYALTTFTGSVATIYGTNWHHIAATKSGTTCIVYWDGLPVVTSTTKNVTGLTNTRIGNRRDGARLWEGGIDDVRVYTSALSASAIATLYTNTGGAVYNSHGSQKWENP